MLTTFPRVSAGVLRVSAGKLDYDRCWLRLASDLHSAFARVNFLRYFRARCGTLPFWGVIFLIWQR